MHFYHVKARCLRPANGVNMLFQDPIHIGTVHGPGDGAVAVEGYGTGGE